MQSMDQLVSVLKSIGRFTFRIHLGDGAQLLVLPHGGRALGLFTATDAPNFLWTNPDFADPGAARKIYGGEWPNVGGDRTWISPEAEFFIRDIKNPMQSHRVPVELDPGSYVVETVGGNPRLVMTRRLHLLQSRISIFTRIIKWFAPARDPLGIQSRDKNVAYAGYSTYVTIELLDGMEHPAALCSLWSLLQLPHGGLAMVSSYRPTDPMIMFGTIPPNDLAVHANCLGFRSQVHGVGKVSVSAIDASGRMAYFYPSTDQSWNLIIRSFPVYPSERYIDTPFTDRKLEGSCVQICNYWTPSVAFTELEYHGPAIGFGTGRSMHHDCCQTWAYRGPAPDIARIAGLLLGDAAEKMALVAANLV